MRARSVPPCRPSNAGVLVHRVDEQLRRLATCEVRVREIEAATPRDVRNQLVVAFVAAGRWS